ncbi:chromosome segregation protein SMC [Streptococcus thermophilus]|uniref:Chromosome partition protein Smc n=1 Tax=Streptococcus thermophilus (strain ATCC BAA-250 / LMG 18311) TaxID=264199 RepID=Q5M3S4_STRT2|nr:chromosome segregation protein SMC [Streptococcus thermophilus]AAV60926.1 chromosome segregation SMC protein [Streptococcus thermophilus LMG 18311]MCT2923982.1 chromosome segregation protein SMC [Streptococcus thermophilus]MCT2930262.1 chromosome segregation protein SMC [Streptococcus thermophilus]MCT2934224.1 chromosome segregation protein SMC [Streptococcus thermophilus]MCT2937490.1 chromosome segregation protein SMC [Streptococcus thermophilus]
MYLKSIEMQGFKSFADKTKVVFDKGVTAVVGPNGSGKSNITESLRWALGESSAKSLRGGKMPDVIFAGTEVRKALNYAEVAVTLDNSDGFIAGVGETIRVERHIYRNGDNDYLIDGRKVRLRDIHDLFMDTGLGRDSFSIISQGRVEAIFNAKPEDRRAIFEEAAGILKYKIRKKETESKLNQTQDNLDRLEDIIYELDGQVKPLEKQAATAKCYLELDGERRQTLLNLLVHDIEVGKSDLTQTQEDLAEVKDKLTSYYEERHRLETENQELKQKRHQISEQISSDQQTLVDVTRLISDFERQIDLYTMESQQRSERKEETVARLSELESLKAEAQASLDKVNQRQVKLNAELNTIAQELTAIQKDLEQFSDDPDTLIEHLREDYVSLMQEEAKVSNSLTQVTHDMESQTQALEAQAEEYKQAQAYLLSAQEVASEAQKAYQAAQASLQNLLDSYKEKDQSYQVIDKDYQEAQTKMFDLMDHLKSKEARRQSLESIQKNHSNFYAGVKSVLQNAQSIQGIIGAVSEHLTFDTRYQTALEIAMGASGQNIIVEDEAAAKRSIDYLKRNRQGRATFLPLTTIKPRQLNGQFAQILANAPGFIGMASDLVTYEERLANIFQNILGVTAIFNTIDNANKAARAVRFQVRMVTLDGSEIRPGGAFAGGANKQNNSLFIKPELDALTTEISQIKAQLSDSEAKVEALKTKRKALQKALEDLKVDGENARLQEQRLGLEYQQALSDVEKNQVLVDSFKQGSQGSEGANLQTKSEQLKAELAQIASKREAINDRIEAIKEDKNALGQQKQALLDRQSELQLKERDLQAELRFAKTENNRLQADLSELTKESDSLKALLNNQVDENQTDRLPQLQAQHKEAVQRKDDLEQALVCAKIQVQDYEGQLEDLEERLAKAGNRNEDLIRQQTRLEERESQISQSLRKFATQLAEDYQMTLEAAKGQVTPLENVEQTRQNLQSLERSIKALGPVNVEAIAQFEEVKQRLDFLNGQKDDLLEAKGLLLNTINDLDGEVKSRFKATFEAIRESFKQTFTQMFGGGSADLILTSDNLLEAGVEISVQPPGKKIQSLNLMSGGEKALSALALLFAIIRVKTIPFVVLDEVEAALDEANVKRFGDYLNRFDKSSQFIVVTHRKGTMSAADSIYGVTMQESGVSKIVSVKLKDLDFD